MDNKTESELMNLDTIKRVALQGGKALSFQHERGDYICQVVTSNGTTYEGTSSGSPLEAELQAYTKLWETKFNMEAA